MCCLCAIWAIGNTICLSFAFIPRKDLRNKKPRVSLDPIKLGAELKQKGLVWDSSNEVSANDCRQDMGCLREITLDNVRKSGDPVDVVLTFKTPGANTTTPETPEAKSIPNARYYTKGNLTVLWLKVPSESDEKLFIQAVDQAYSQSQK